MTILLTKDLIAVAIIVWYPCKCEAFRNIAYGRQPGALEECQWRLCRA